VNLTDGPRRASRPCPSSSRASPSC
jgi:hypothetical protein